MIFCKLSILTLCFSTSSLVISLKLSYARNLASERIVFSSILEVKSSKRLKNNAAFKLSYSEVSSSRRFYSYTAFL